MRGRRQKLSNERSPPCCSRRQTVQGRLQQRLNAFHMMAFLQFELCRALFASECTCRNVQEREALLLE